MKPCIAKLAIALQWTTKRCSNARLVHLLSRKDISRPSVWWASGLGKSPRRMEDRKFISPVLSRVLCLPGPDSHHGQLTLAHCRTASCGPLGVFLECRISSLASIYTQNMREGRESRSVAAWPKCMTVTQGEVNPPDRGTGQFLEVSAHTGKWEASEVCIWSEVTSQTSS